jgi:hypothetical protein
VPGLGEGIGNVVTRGKERFGETVSGENAKVAVEDDQGYGKALDQTARMASGVRVGSGGWNVLMLGFGHEVIRTRCVAGRNT